MAVKVRLRGQGATNRVMYRVVVADSRSRLHGEYIECVGTFNPFAKEESRVQIKPDRIQHWITNGAQLTDTVENLVKKVSPETIQMLQEKRNQIKRNKAQSKKRAKK